MSHISLCSVYLNRDKHYLKRKRRRLWYDKGESGLASGADEQNDGKR